MNRAVIKTPEAIELMREAGRLLASVFAMLDTHLKAGMTTLEIDALVEDYIVNTLNARPASKGQYGFQYSLNTSINHVVCHGVPSAADVLREGDIVNLDITLEKNGYISDSSKMYRIGSVSTEAERLIDTTYEAMWQGIRCVRPGARLGDIGHAIQRHAEAAGYSVVREYCGHGIGQEMHEEPQVMHVGRPGTGMPLKAGMTFTIEPMINAGTHRTRTLKDGWTVITQDRRLSAQWEHTVLVTETGVEVLTLREEEK